MPQLVRHDIYMAVGAVSVPRLFPSLRVCILKIYKHKRGNL